MTDTKPMGIPFHLRERFMEGALLSCWLYCADIGFVYVFQFLLVCASGRAKRFLLSCVFFCLLVRLAGVNCFVFLVLVLSPSSSPVVGFPLAGLFPHLLLV